MRRPDMLSPRDERGHTISKEVQAVAQLPIRSLTIYKQGIGYFRRRGQIDDSTVSLVVPRDSLNDVLHT